MNKDISNYNTKNKLHGYLERYTYDNRLIVRTYMNNGNLNGYLEYHLTKETKFYIT